MKSDFEKALRESLFSEIKNRNGCNLQCVESLGSTWIKDDELTTEFRYTALANRLIVSRVAFKNRHRGCMTTCFEILKHFATNLNYDIIVIQSVETCEMMQWCLKMGFTAPSCNFMTRDSQGRSVLLGDYHYVIKDH